MPDHEVAVIRHAGPVRQRALWRSEATKISINANGCAAAADGRVDWLASRGKLDVPSPAPTRKILSSFRRVERVRHGYVQSNRQANVTDARELIVNPPN